MPDWQVTAARRALGLARSMILCGESMSPEAQAEIDAALHYLVPYDMSRPEPSRPARKPKRMSDARPVRVLPGITVAPHVAERWGVPPEDGDDAA